MVKISDLPIFNPQGNTLDSFLDNSLQDSSPFGHAFLDKRPLLKQDPLPMVFGIEDHLDKIGSEMIAVIFKERLLLDNTLLLHQHLPPLSQIGKDYALFVMVVIGDKGKQAVRAVRVSKVVSTLMLNANTNVSVLVNISNQVLSLLGFVGKHPLNVLVDSGCSTNFVSTMLVSKLRLPTQQSVEAFRVELADGSYLQCNKTVQQLEFQIQDYQDQLGFLVMPLSHYDMILGQSWLYQYDPIISFRDHSIRLYQNNQELELRGLFNTQPITMVCAMQVKHLVRRNCTIALVMLHEAEDDTEIVVGRVGTEMLTNEAGEVTSHLQGMFTRTIRLLEAGIKPVYVFDGKPPELKKAELAKRFSRREDATAGLAEAVETGDKADIEKYSKRTVKVTKQHNEDCRKLLGLMGVPVIEVKR
ncbi:hypothetical protein L7F22_069100 [Adiantum nelumboides]|nr:hypothetical protein [Adiantum nelumboides]